MQALFDAIYLEFTTGIAAITLRTLTATPLSMFDGRAQQGALFPLIETRMPASGASWSNSSEFEDPLVDFHVWDTNRDPAIASAIADEIVTVFRNNLLTVVGFSMISANLGTRGKTPQPNEKGWNFRVGIQYEIGS